MLSDRPWVWCVMLGLLLTVGWNEGGSFLRNLNRWLK